jgi:cbb3-type cytochrome oxidase subunit 1
MHGAARLFFMLAIAYAIGGMLLGLSMSMGTDHTTQMPTHAHTMAAGWLMSSIFAFFYHLFPDIGKSTLAKAHFWLQGLSGVALVISLYFLRGGMESVGAITAISSFGFLGGMLLFVWISLPVLKTA